MVKISPLIIKKKNWAFWNLVIKDETIIKIIKLSEKNLIKIIALKKISLNINIRTCKSNEI
jgi:hypothetical protein